MRLLLAGRACFRAYPESPRPGEPDARGQAVHERNRNMDFRKAGRVAIDRQRLGDFLARGPDQANPIPAGFFVPR